MRLHARCDQHILQLLCLLLCLLEPPQCATAADKAELRAHSDRFTAQVSPLTLEFGRLRLRWVEEEFTPTPASAVGGARGGEVGARSWDEQPYGRAAFIPGTRHWWTELDTTVTPFPVGIPASTLVSVVPAITLTTPDDETLSKHFVLQTRVCLDVDAAFPFAYAAFSAGRMEFQSVPQEENGGEHCSKWSTRKPRDGQPYGELPNAFLPRQTGELTLRLEARVCSCPFCAMHRVDDGTVGDGGGVGGGVGGGGGRHVYNLSTGAAEQCSVIRSSDPVHVDVTTREHVVLDVMSAPSASIDVVNGFSEFTFEMALTVPYAFFLHRIGKLKSVTSFESMRECCYYFAEHFTPVPEGTLRGSTAIGLSMHGGINPTSYMQSLDFRMWAPPPFRERFATARQSAAAGSALLFPWESAGPAGTASSAKPVMIIHNKATDGIFVEFESGARMPMLSASCLQTIFDEYASRYTIVYVGKVVRGTRGYGLDTGERWNATGFRGDGRASTFDKTESADERLSRISQLLAAHPEIYRFNSLLKRYSSLDYNVLQFLLHAQSQHFVSCTGGSSVVASYFGGTNIVVTNYHTPTRAVGGYLSALASTHVVLVRYERDLLEAMERLF